MLYHFVGYVCDVLCLPAGWKTLRFLCITVSRNAYVAAKHWTIFKHVHIYIYIYVLYRSTWSYYTQYPIPKLIIMTRLSGMILYWYGSQTCNLNQSRIMLHDVLGFCEAYATVNWHNLMQRVFFVLKWLIVALYVTCNFSLSATSCFIVDIMWIAWENLV